jgi:DNA invertase Pin-like site-specific DNA recombinase
MKILYTRISTEKQSHERQLENEEDYQLVIKERVSGSVPFFDRPKTSKILELLETGEVEQIDVHSIDRLGRNLKDILITIEKIHSYGVSIFIISQGLMTMDKETGEINPTTKLILSVMGSVSEMERNLIQERITHSLRVKKSRGELLGRKRGSVEDVESFLNKSKSKKIKDYLMKGYSYREIGKIVGCGTQLVGKVKRMSEVV